MKEYNPSRVVLGKIVGVYGVKGWVRVFSETAPREGILGYSPWLIGSGGSPCRVAEGKVHRKGLIVRLDGCEDRDEAAVLVGQEISVPRDRLPPPHSDEFYWVDLEGLAVFTVSGVDLGRVDHLFPTGANDVLVVKGDRERLIPFVWDEVVKDVDFTARRIDVDWDPDF
ncbi:Ribosome maturation factor rimM [Thiorhodococcus drewsii AZ1]|uniref:Ribosome maturation factor RimM n=1 Tax=Thiorhodococcus drewsii AZ1 TaxID=765913 RepID=G2DZ21_9GAMM|nr:ribosome maturation factor RimM [Thiorhodococcus drewsii]EGV32375.1 Ribosome maturation factor rimM [Thiorhodococcus drewsii AZ1]